MPLRRHHSPTSTSAQIALDIPSSPTSSYEEIPYGNHNSYTSQSSQHYSDSINQYPSLDDVHLPLHNMETESRRRNVGFEQPSTAGWVPGNPRYDSYPTPHYFNDVDGKGVYEKARVGYATGKLPPRQTKEREPWYHQWAPMAYTIVSIWSRIYAIGFSPYVIWDEAHFGKFASHYLKREFYFDVHPPLGKMLVAFVGLVSGYDGSFEFKSGEQYPSNVPYISMRVLLSFFGVAMVPLGWYTAKELHFSMRARHLVACMVLFGNCKVLLIVPVSSLLSDLRRPVMAYHQSFHSSRFVAVVLHMYHGVLPDQVP